MERKFCSNPKCPLHEFEDNGHPVNRRGDYGKIFQIKNHLMVNAETGRKEVFCDTCKGAVEVFIEIKNDS